MNSEEQYIEMEAARIDSSEQYFSARPQIDTNDRRKVFESGFDRGWQAALSAKSVPVARSLDFEAMHTPFGIHATPQHANKVLERGMTLRDAMAMSVRLPDDYSAKWGEALIGEQRQNDVEPVSVHIDWWMRVEAVYRYRMADAMLKARETSND